MRLRLLMPVLILLFLACCQKREPAPPRTGVLPPEGPLHKLAFNAAAAIKNDFLKQELPFEIQILRIQNPAGLPDQAIGYFRSVLEYQIRQAGGIISSSGSPLTGSFENVKKEQTEFLNFEFQITHKGIVVVQGESQIPKNQQLEQTLAYFKPDAGIDQEVEDPHAHHREALIPTPVAIISQPVLDVGQSCDSNQDYCNVVILYQDSLELLDWKTGERSLKSFPREVFASIRSRAPSGKIISGPGLFTILNSNFSSPLFYDSKWAGPLSGTPQPFLPVPEPGLNSYALKNGKFYDFELIEARGLAVIETSHRLSIATAGTISTASEFVGDAIALNLPSVYTSAPVFMNERDSIMKFNYDGTSLTLESTRQSEGTILDLSVTDLNRDGTTELLVTVQRKDGSYIEVWDTF